ncbi:MAG: AP2 domain-containing protein, partial [Sedimentisphaerales bacterium]
GYNKRKRKNASSQYIGVSYDKNYKQWVAQISYDGKLHWLGRFTNEIDAARAYDEASKKYHLEFKRLNFP